MNRETVFENDEPLMEVFGIISSKDWQLFQKKSSEIILTPNLVTRNS